MKICKNMCEIINNGGITAIICGGKKDHECNDSARVYETSDGERHFFKSEIMAEKWYSENYERTVMGSVACSICEGASADNMKNWF